MAPAAAGASLRYDQDSEHQPPPRSGDRAERQKRATVVASLALEPSGDLLLEQVHPGVGGVEPVLDPSEASVEAAGGGLLTPVLFVEPIMQTGEVAVDRREPSGHRLEPGIHAGFELPSLAPGGLLASTGSALMAQHSFPCWRRRVAMGRRSWSAALPWPHGHGLKGAPPIR
jgi:hypothetical protein